jgi:hypothetical protein
MEELAQLIDDLEIDGKFIIKILNHFNSFFF